jgi:hypothetical protein
MIYGYLWVNIGDGLQYTMQGWWMNFLRSAVFKQHIIDDWQAWIYPKKGRFNNEKGDATIPQLEM